MMSVEKKMMAEVVVVARMHERETETMFERQRWQWQPGHVNSGDGGNAYRLVHQQSW
jgi:hypothetical protein